MEHEEVNSGAKGVAIEPKSICNKNASSMECFCMRCPNFALIFKTDVFLEMYGEVCPDNWIEKAKQNNPSLKGTIHGVCFYSETRHLVGKDMTDATLDWGDSDMLKGGRMYFLFGVDNVPCSLADCVREFIASRECILQAGKKDCMYFIEREMKEWNTKK